MVIKGNTVGHPLPDPRRGLAMAGDIQMNGQRLTGLAAPQSDDEAVNWGSVKDLGKAAFTESCLRADGWTADENAGFVQTVTVEDLTDDKKVRVFPAFSGTLDARIALGLETPKVRCCRRSGDKLTFEAWEAQPELDIPIEVEVVI